jgi:hypothetical protein
MQLSTILRSGEVGTRSESLGNVGTTFPDAMIPNRGRSTFRNQCEVRRHRQAEVRRSVLGPHGVALPRSSHMRLHRAHEAGAFIRMGALVQLRRM